MGLWDYRLSLQTDRSLRPRRLGMTRHVLAPAAVKSDASDKK